MKTRTEHEIIFKSYPAPKLKEIIKRTNISLTGLKKSEIITAMLKRRRAFDWMEKYDGTDKYKTHPKFKTMGKEKDNEQEKKDIKSNQKVRKFKGGGRSKVVGAQPKITSKKAIKNPTYTSIY
jgi:hypothetical protein